MTPTVGRIVHYRLSQQDIDHLRLTNARGNGLRAGDVVPLIVVRVWPEEYVSCAPGRWVDRDGQDVWESFEVLGPEGVNGQAVLDGPASFLWVTSASQGPNEGQWMWPERV